MNFSEKKQDNLTKKTMVRAFEVNDDNTHILFDQIRSEKKFKVNKIVKMSTTKHLKLKSFSTKNNKHFLHFSLYNPKEQVAVSPTVSGQKDLLDVENHDNLHAFYMVKGNKIACLLLISTNWPEVKTAKIFENFGILIKPKVILKQNVVARIKADGFRAVHVNFEVSESDFVHKPSFLDSFMKNEPALKQEGISGHLTIDARGNSALAKSIEKDPQPWVDELDSDFWIETKKGEKITGDDLRLTKTYYTVPYGSKSISAKYAEEILNDFVDKELK